MLRHVEPNPVDVSAVHARPYRHSSDFEAVRSLLVDTYSATPLAFNWEVRRWDELSFHRTTAPSPPDWVIGARIWETESGSVVGAVHPEGPSSAQIQIHPAHRHLEDEMIGWAKRNLTEPSGRRLTEVSISALDQDTARRRILGEHGFRPTGSMGIDRRLRLQDRPARRVTVHTGYRIRTTDPHDPHDPERMAALLNASFGRTSHSASEYWAFARHSPSFDHHLNLVAEAKDGTLAAHVGVALEPINRYGVVKPVCTHPAHRRLGLAAALIDEALDRLSHIGGEEALVSTGDGVAANRLYAEAGFTEVTRWTTWRKRVGS